MKKRNILIMTLLILGLVVLTLVEGYIKPEMRRKEERYLAEQADPLTHDFSRLPEFKSRYMGDASNLANLNAHLPLSELPRTIQLYPEILTAEINYQGPAAAIEADLFARALLYNTTANFALIDNLEALHLNFEDRSYSVSRRAVEDWYGAALSTLLEREGWIEKVQRPLADKGYVSSFIEENIK